MSSSYLIVFWLSLYQYPFCPITICILKLRALSKFNEQSLIPSLYLHFVLILQQLVYLLINIYQILINIK